MQPYRLKVLLVENKRVNGKVKQETVAVLGSIEAVWLESFWQAYDPKLRTDGWQLRSLRARSAFWKECNTRLARLENRLGPHLKRTRIAVHKRVPWPMEPERNLLERLEAERDVKDCRSSYEYTKKRIESNERMIERALQQNTELRQDALNEARAIAKAREKVERLK